MATKKTLSSSTLVAKASDSITKSALKKASAKKKSPTKGPVKKAGASKVATKSSASATTPRTKATRTPAKAKAKAKGNKSVASPVTASERNQRIALAAYLLAESRNFEPGGEVADWLRAEQQVDAALLASCKR